MRWCATHRPVTGFTVDPLASTGPCRPHLVVGGVTAGLGAGRVTWVDSGRMVGPPNHHPNTTHTPKGAGPPGGPSQVEVSKGRSGCAVASSVPLCLQEEGQGMAQGVAPPRPRGVSSAHALCSISKERYHYSSVFNASPFTDF